MITETLSNLRRAVKNITLDPEIHSVLREKCPAQLEELETAVGDADRMAREISDREDLLDAMIKHRAEGIRIGEVIEKLNYE